MYKKLPAFAIRRDANFPAVHHNRSAKQERHQPDCNRCHDRILQGPTFRPWGILAYN